ncbi:hypothetical protein AAG570_009776 [Ranatra chinensis]|uniref:Uncharacterized protein n=1 Tax=Ranatra chinensis TaxID=642074 RepID=A0ABD0YQN9_9HEMI
MAAKRRNMFYQNKKQLIVDNLPTDSIKSSETHKITHIGKNNMVSICVGEIEVWLEIEQPYIELSHYYLSFFTKPLIVQKLDVAAHNRSCASLKVQWERKVNQIVEIYVEPEKAVIGKDSVHIFRLCVRFVQEGEFSDTIRCVLCNHDMYINVRLEGRTEPSTVISSDILDFGLIKQGAEVRKKCYLVTNSSSEEPKICMRLLEWLIGGQVSYTHVIGDVQTTDVCLNPSGEWKIDQGPLYVGTHRSLAPFRLHNRTRLPTKFYWKPPIETVCRVDVLPAKGTLLPAEDKDIRVIIYPKTEVKETEENWLSEAEWSVFDEGRKKLLPTLKNYIDIDSD